MKSFSNKPYDFSVFNHAQVKREFTEFQCAQMTKMALTKLRDYLTMEQRTQYFQCQSKITTFYTANRTSGTYQHLTMRRKKVVMG